MNIWYLRDERPGHQNQVLGLLTALERKTEIEVHEIPIASIKANVFTWLFGNCTVPDNLGSPDLIIGAGHRTHWALISLTKQTLAKSVVLMRPSLPLSLFDFICAPLHDRLPNRKNFLSTEGAINRIQPSQKSSKFGMILIGGPSSHAQWENKLIVQQINQLLELTPEMKWTLTTSRRTPESLTKEIMPNENIKIVPWQQCEKNWLPTKLSKAEIVWVTPDSVSMIYEALTANAKVGLLQLKIIPTRVSMGIEKLLSEKIIADFKEWKINKQWNLKNKKLDEAERCACWLLDNLDSSK